MNTKRYFATMYILFGLMFLLAATSAFATDVQINCTAPTKNTDGTSITGPITYNLYGAKQGVAKQKLVNAATACSFTRFNVSTGVQEYYVTAVVGGVESDPSSTASITIEPPPPPKPNAPTGTVVIIITVTATP